MGGDWQKTPAYAVFVPYLCMCAFGVVNPWTHCKKQVVLFAPQNKKIHSVHECGIILSQKSSIHVWLMMCFLIFCNQRPNTKHIFQFTEGVVGKLESKNMENTDKNSIFVPKNMRKTAWFCSKNHEKPWKNISINILTSKLWKMWVCAFGKFKKTKHVTVLVWNCGKLHAERAGNHNFGFTTICANFAIASPLYYFFLTWRDLLLCESQMAEQKHWWINRCFSCIYLSLWLLVWVLTNWLIVALYLMTDLPPALVVTCFCFFPLPSPFSTPYSLFHS